MMDKSGKLYFPDTVGDIVVGEDLSVVCRTDTMKPRAPSEPEHSEVSDNFKMFHRATSIQLQKYMRRSLEILKLQFANNVK